MLDIQFIRDNKERVIKAVEAKNMHVDLDELLKLDDLRKTLQQQGDELRKQRNEIAEKLQDPSTRTPEMMEVGKKIKEEIAIIEKETNLVVSSLMALMMKVPNVYSEDTPIGATDDENVEIAQHGTIPSFSFHIKDHIEIGQNLDIIDLDRGVKVSGFRGYFLKNEGAQLHLAVLMYTFNKLVAKGFTPFIVPTIVKEETLVSMGQFPAHRGETYEVLSGGREEGEQKFLAGTAEVGLLSYFADEIIDENQLPLKMVGFSPSYRSEAGSHGKDTKGLYRVHEFAKIEQLILGKNDLTASLELLEELRGISEEILQDLGLPYRVLSICTGDMGQGKYKMYDLETWMPSRNNYGETHSDSLLTDWQARRANIRYKKGESLEYVHTLNNTAIASPRILIALLENYQNEDGSITIPEVLRPYMQGKTIIQRK